MSYPSLPPLDSAPKAELRFCLHQLDTRDELLLKSLIRLLSHRTHQRWLYCAEGPVNMVVMGDSLLESTPEMDKRIQTALHSGSTLRLDIGHASKRQAYFLYLPLNANALEQMLNQIGAAVAAGQKNPGLFSSPALPVAHFSATSTFRLLRWPPTALLDKPEHRKLATLLAGKPQLLAVLQQRSGLALAECEHFLQALQHALLLETTVPAGAMQAPIETPAPAGESPVHWKASLGLVARIRNRLGLTSSTTS